MQADVMNPLLKKILDTQTVSTPAGEQLPLHSSIDLKEVEFLQKLICKNKPTDSLEIGCAMGISSLAICAALSTYKTSGVHTIIDPFQSTDWKKIGMYNLETAGFKNYQLLEERSEFALPKLVQEGYTVDFAFIDGWHTFDHTLIDFFYINRMLRKGGVVVIDDVSMPAVKKVMRLIHTYPAYQLLGGVEVSYSRKMQLLEAFKLAVRPLAKMMGNKVSGELMNASILHSDRALGLNCSVVAFQKIGEDQRPWNWFEPF